MVSVTLAAGCGGSSSSVPEASSPASPATAAPEKHAAAVASVTCAALLPAGELRAILGAEPARLNERSNPGSADCTWHYTAPGATYETFFQVLVDATEMAVPMWLPTRDSEARMDSREPNAVAGIGDEAYAWTGQADYRRLYVRQGSRTLVIRGPVALPALAAEPAMTELAATLLGRF
jgi:hypothetical protein